jgi:hypothetical protein
MSFTRGNPRCGSADGSSAPPHQVRRTGSAALGDPGGAADMLRGSRTLGGSPAEYPGGLHLRLARRSSWLLAAVAVFGAAAVLGWQTAERVTPDLIRVEIQDRLEAALGSPVRVRSVALTLGLRLELIGRGIEAYPGPDGPALQVDRVVAEVRPFSHLTGQRRLRRLSLEGATLRIGRDAKGAWAPAALADRLVRDEPEAPGAMRHPDEILSPLIVLEAGARSLLESELPADRLELREGRIEWRAPEAGGRARSGARAAAREVAFEGIAAEMRHRPLLGETLLHLHARLAEANSERGSVDIEGRLSRDGSLHFALAATELDLRAATAPATARPPELAGTATGVVLFDAPEPGSGRFEVDLVGRDVRGAAPALEAGLGPLASKRIELAGTVEIDPERVRLRGARLRGDRLALRLDGQVERPLDRTSPSDLSLALEGAHLDDLRTLLAWLPEVEREEAFALLANLEAGRAHRLEVAGAASLAGWQEFLAGRSDRAPRDFVLLAELEDVRLRAGDDPIEELEGRLAWQADRLEVSGLRARLGGRPLPALDLEVDGISSFFATDPERRRLRASAPPLAGLGALWKDLRPEDDGQPGRMPVALALEIERLEHPMFLWPIEGLAAEIAPIEQGVRIEARDGTWGGVPIELASDWLFEPEERVIARVVAGRAEGAAPAPADPAAAPVDPAASPAEPVEAPAAPAGVPAEPAAAPAVAGDGAWAQGRLSLGPVDAPRWKQHGATAAFAVHGARLILSDAKLDLAPHGRGVANARVDLSRPESAPFQISFEIFDADLPTLGASVRLPAEIASGRVDVAGSLDGAFDPAKPIVGSLEGLVEADARNGTLRREVPAVMALALASEVLAPIGKREIVRYDRMRSLLALDRGRLSTDSLSLDGPDARAFASGEVSIGPAPHEVDIDVVLFLFRPVDWVLDKIPIVNFLLLGPNRNLLAAHYELSGTWEAPSARLVPLESFTTGPGTLVFERLPSIVARGLEALGGLLGRDSVAGPQVPPPPEVEAPPPRES